VTRPSTLATQVRTELKLFWREPADLFFTALLPVVFLVLFAAIFGNERIDERGGIRVAHLQVPGFIALAIVSATFVSLAISLVVKRERAVLKRARATPVAPAVVFGGLVAKSILVALVVAAALMLVGGLLYDVTLSLAQLPALLVALVVGAAAFCCLGVAVTAVIGSEEAAPAITNAVTLPLFFISGIFVPETELPDGLATAGDVLPVGPLVDALAVAFDPAATGAGIAAGELAIVAAWGAAGLALAIAGFRWTPRRERE